MTDIELDKATTFANAVTAYEKAAAKQYLGDAVYFSFDGYHVWLATEDGIGTTNRVALDPSVVEHFMRCFERLKTTIKDLNDAHRKVQQNGDGTGEIQSGGGRTSDKATGTGIGSDSDRGNPG